MCFEFILIYLYFDITEGDKGGFFLYFRYIQGIDIVLFQDYIICCKQKRYPFAAFPLTYTQIYPLMVGIEMVCCRLTIDIPADNDHTGQA